MLGELETYVLGVQCTYSFRAIGTMAMEKYPNLDHLFLLELGIEDNFWRKVGLLEMFLGHTGVG